jgi:hypothetical protein
MVIKIMHQNNFFCKKKKKKTGRPILLYKTSVRKQAERKRDRERERERDRDCIVCIIIIIFSNEHQANISNIFSFMI